jgi:secreted Zn-dependent insulinase-like peptidase
VIKSNHKFYFDRLKAVDKIDFNRMKEFLHNFFKSLKVIVLIQGNFIESEALKINETIINNLQLTCTSQINDKVSNYAFQIPTGDTYLKVKSLLPNDKNSIIKNYYQIGSTSIECECLLEVLVKAIREPLFNCLRTQEQLGYSVSCASKFDNNVLGFSITVEAQEKKNSARHVDARIENFLSHFHSMLDAMSEEDFNTIKQSIINQKRSLDIDLESEVMRNWHEIRERKYQFERSEIEARQIELLNKNSLQIFFNEYVMASSKSRRKLSIQVLANADDDVSLLQHGYIHLDLINNDDSRNCVRNLLQFRDSLLKI